MAKSRKKAAKKRPALAATKATTAEAKSGKRAVPSGAADNIRAFLKQATSPVTLAQLNAGLSKTHSSASVYTALQYMIGRKEAVRRGRGATATYAIRSTGSLKSAPAKKMRRGRKASSSQTASAPATSNFASMVAELKRMAQSAENAIVQRAINSSDFAVRSLAEMATDLRARAAALLGK
jgi:hypothetical protein